MTNIKTRFLAITCALILSLGIGLASAPSTAQASDLVSPQAMYEEVLDYYKNFYGPKITHERFEVAYKRLAFKTSYQQTEIKVTSEWGEYNGWLGHEWGTINTYKAYYKVW